MATGTLTGNEKVKLDALKAVYDHVNGEMDDIKSAIGAEQSTISTTESEPYNGYWGRNSKGIAVKLEKEQLRTLENPIDISSLSPGVKVSVLATVNSAYGAFITDADYHTLDYVNGNNAAEKGYETGTSIPQLVTLTVPQSAKYIMSDIYSTYYTGLSDFDVTVYNDSIIAVNAHVAEVDARVAEANTSINEIICPNLEVGQIYIVTDPESPWTYQDSNKYVRTKSGYTVHLSIGDKIGLSSYDDGQRYSIGWRYNGGSYGRELAMTAEYTVSAEGDYVIVLYQEPKTNYTNPYDLGKLLYIKRAEYAVNQFKRIDKYPIKGIGHRGYTAGGAPENTIWSFRAAKTQGFHYVETDLAFTSDNVAVLSHDPTINRTGRNSDGSVISSTININDITYAQALEYDFGIWKGEQYAGTRIMTVEELLIFCRANDMYPYIEIKSNVGFSTENCAAVIDIIKKYGMVDSCAFISFGYANLLTVSKIAPTIKIGHIYDDTFSDTMKARLLNMKTGYNTVMFDPYVATLEGSKSEILQFCQQNGIVLGIAMTDDQDVMRGADNYITECCSNAYNFEEVIANREMGVT